MANLRMSTYMKEVNVTDFGMSTYMELPSVADLGMSIDMKEVNAACFPM